MFFMYEDMELALGRKVIMQITLKVQKATLIRSNC